MVKTELGLVKELKEAFGYVDLFLKDLESDEGESIIENPQDCLNFINYAIQKAIIFIQENKIVS